MCGGCYDEFFEKGQKPVPAVTGEMRELAGMIKANDADCQLSYGRLHIVVADWNLDDDDIAYCLDEEEEHSQDMSELERAIGQRLLALTVPERYVVMHLADA